MPAAHMPVAGVPAGCGAACCTGYRCSGDRFFALQYSIGRFVKRLQWHHIADDAVQLLLKHGAYTGSFLGVAQA